MEYINSKVLGNSKSICIALYSFEFAYSAIAVFGFVQLSVLSILLAIQCRILIDAINTLFLSADYSALIVGLFGIPVLVSVAVWPFCLLKIGLMNLVYARVGNYRAFPYQIEMDAIQNRLVSVFCKWCFQKQLETTMVLGLPFELILEVNKYIIPSPTPSYLQRLPSYDNRKAIIDNCVFAPDYAVYSHKGVWAVVCCKEVLNISFFVVGYFTTLRIIWML